MTEAKSRSDAAAVASAESSSQFTMVAGDPAAMVCEGDVCHIAGFGGE